MPTRLAQDPQPAKRGAGPWTSLVANMVSGIRQGALLAFVWTLIIAVVLAYEEDWSAYVISPLQLLTWLWLTAFFGGAAWGAMKRWRTELSGYIASGIPVGIIFTVSLGLVMGLGPRITLDITLLMLLLAAGIASGAWLGFLLWGYRRFTGH